MKKERNYELTKTWFGLNNLAWLLRIDEISFSNEDSKAWKHRNEDSTKCMPMIKIKPFDIFF